jgi:hypothetical protein
MCGCCNEESIVSEQLERRLNSHTYHRPSAPVQQTMSQVREAFMHLVSMLDGAIPEGREKALAFTALEESGMWAMKALALSDPAGEVISPQLDRARLGAA